MDHFRPFLKFDDREQPIYENLTPKTFSYTKNAFMQQNLFVEQIVHHFYSKMSQPVAYGLLRRKK